MCRLLLLLSLVLSASAASSVEKVAQKYRHAILQSGLPITIDARVRGASQVSVKLAGVTYEAKVGGQGKAGRARLEIPALPAGGPYDMVFSDDKGRSATAEDVYLSDVWLCIGQSNMFSHDQNAQQGHLGIGRNGWTQATSIDVIKNMAGTPYYFARALHRELDRPIGIVVAGRGGTTLWQWTAEELHQTPELVPYRAVMEQRNRAYEEQKKKKIKNISYEPAAGFSPYRYPYFGFTFGEMAGFDNWVPNFKGKGIVFWQGENDIGLGAPYEQLCGGMVNRWRERADRQWPFFFIQLPTYMDKARKPSKYRGIEVIRDAQRRVAAADPLSHMMVSYDIYGRGIHPSSKVAYGERLAQTVLGIVYDKEIPWRSPEFIGAERSADGMELRFDHVRQGLKTRGGEAELKGFVLAGDDGVFHPATAEITAKDTVVVRSDLVPAPSAVRYAWATNPVANLVGDGDLPVSPFRSDDWPLYPLDN